MWRYYGPFFNITIHDKSTVLLKPIGDDGRHGVVWKTKQQNIVSKRAPFFSPFQMLFFYGHDGGEEMRFFLSSLVRCYAAAHLTRMAREGGRTRLEEMKKKKKKEETRALKMNRAGP